jgi:hypothetical protein
LLGLILRGREEGREVMGSLDEIMSGYDGLRTSQTTSKDLP